MVKYFQQFTSVTLLLIPKSVHTPVATHWEMVLIYKLGTLDSGLILLLLILFYIFMV